MPKSTSAKHKPVENNKSFAYGEVVWAKVEPYSWWPALAYEPAGDEPMMHRDRRGRLVLNVLFIEEVPTFNTVPVSTNVLRYSDINVDEMKELGLINTTPTAWKQAVLDANTLSTIPDPVERIKMLDKRLLFEKVPRRAYCTCKVMLSPKTVSTGDKKSRMILCTSCGDWFHLSCLGLSAVPKPLRNWRCEECLGTMSLSSLKKINESPKTHHTHMAKKIRKLEQGPSNEQESNAAKRVKMEDNSDAETSKETATFSYGSWTVESVVRPPKKPAAGRPGGSGASQEATIKIESESPDRRSSPRIVAKESRLLLRTTAGESSKRSLALKANGETAEFLASQRDQTKQEPSTSSTGNGMVAAVKTEGAAPSVELAAFAAIDDSVRQFLEEDDKSVECF